ncbi:hypothetical protein [Priestia flexa]|uniref:hypothetical protein n=1 Tax=Priestia flexa TaxID=86664 RepID=UPI000C23BF4D|nr:hypothetical protein [Priestia flexa]MBN8435046.1 hypothetical protein [Priestia flexa]MCA0967451.1 hypothetical protein [Priestia flexa]MEC0667278.1 hypothetical protein [Priestia flexa]MED3825685.1 hypothetical protein [Priestia flexa]
MVNYIKWPDLLFMLILTIILVFDYFPNPMFTKILPQAAFVLFVSVIGLLFILSIIIRIRSEEKVAEGLIGQIILTVYIVVVMTILSLLGGESTSGVSFSNWIFWGVLSLSLFEIYSRWKKVKQKEA